MSTDAPTVDTHGERIAFGRHAGELYTRLPVSYLRWLANIEHPTAGPIARAELARRGTTLPTLEISHHAIDRASLRALDFWRAERRKDEGLYRWLHRRAVAARESAGPTLETDRVDHDGIRFVFERDGAWPVLKTVMRRGRPNGR